ncbi:uncharacterized protein Z518_08989 [Rhinocladiella mackenziei CBS 650.93]|uniref:Rhinocladiella mackenziei CBS 650.93 unplaced genomic scaffold supercont1.7, whole genome shotgun sequence n=1 Tax=Rhinocladiella mackenziei CBS 650.93 TaxID=1442369 RepID=A0A0D2I631_9EURO|nr:uncharacterized protein Z518_08989 [Rhinocladiella mackenziei CBS 650.93]KIX01264.1 hypothetical protein Z518_08989 [Rhinocladiella mackenziei CBS 650.93]
MATSTSASSSTLSPTPSPTGSADNGGNGPSSPLLFFVALGFGVVFTNLWIIVGVKYCFRYNQRNRQRMNGEDSDGVDLGTMPRQHRRRREKKLMTMEEVNEKFPLIKYKTWRSNRAEEGLPTAGGINTASRPASIHDMSRESKDLKDSSVAQELSHAQTTSTEDEKSGDPALAKPEVGVGEKSASQDLPSTPSRPKSTQSTVTPGSPIQKVTSNDEDDDDDHIQTAVPAEQLPDPGDSCAICLDTIDDDDDIRGLHCGHAFHASCVDPWLTSRRACCPLCKADYYVPKPRPEGANGEGLARSGTHSDVQPPPTAFSVIGNGRVGRRPAMIIPGRFMNIVYHDRDRHGFPLVVRADRIDQPHRLEHTERPRQRRLSATTAVNGGFSDTQSPSTGWRSRFAGFRLLGRGRAAPLNPNRGVAVPEAAPTPSQLEAGR